MRDRGIKLVFLCIGWFLRGPDKNTIAINVWAYKGLCGNSLINRQIQSLPANWNLQMRQNTSHYGQVLCQDHRQRLPSFGHRRHGILETSPSTDGELRSSSADQLRISVSCARASLVAGRKDPSTVTCYVLRIDLDEQTPLPNCRHRTNTPKALPRGEPTRESDFMSGSPRSNGIK